MTCFHDRAKFDLFVSRPGHVVSPQTDTNTYGRNETKKKGVGGWMDGWIKEEKNKKRRSLE
jgi:hypothetical protein